MKRMLKWSVFAVACAMAIPFTYAQDKDAPPPPPPGDQGGQHKGGPGGDRLKMLADKLGLTEDQKTKIKGILEDEMKTGKAIRDDQTLDRDAKRAKFEEVRKSHREQIRALLTPDQQKKFDELKEERGGPGGGQHKPKDQE